MKFLPYVILAIACTMTILGCSHKMARKLHLNVSGGEIDPEEVRKELNKHFDNLDVETSQKYFESLIASEEEWCLAKYVDGRCKKWSSVPPTFLSEIVSKTKSCADEFRSCQAQDIDRKTAEDCLRDDALTSCQRYSGNEHKSKFVEKRLEEIKQLLPTLKYSNRTVSAHIADAYNKCMNNSAWGYVAQEKPRESNIYMYSKAGKKQVVGNFQTESECHEARILAKDKKDLDISDKCIKRYAGKDDVVVAVYKAKAMIKSEEENIVRDRVITFSGREICQRNVEKKRKYRFQVYEHEYIEPEIGAIKSSDPSRFISGCKEATETVCVKDEVGFRKIDTSDFESEAGI